MNVATKVEVNAPVKISRICEFRVIMGIMTGLLGCCSHSCRWHWNIITDTSIWFLSPCFSLLHNRQHAKQFGMEQLTWNIFNRFPLWIQPSSLIKIQSADCWQMSETARPFRGVETAIAQNIYDEYRESDYERSHQGRGECPPPQSSPPNRFVVRYHFRQHAYVCKLSMWIIGTWCPGVCEKSRQLIGKACT